MSKENLFEHSFRNQYLHVSHVVARVREYDAQEEERYIDFIVDQMNLIGSLLAEKETIPAWVTDPMDYYRKSEIVLFLSIFEAINWASLRENISDFHPRNFIKALYKKIIKHGKKRNWNLQVFQLQFSKLIGTQFISQMNEHVLPGKIEDSGYN